MNANKKDTKVLKQQAIVSEVIVPMKSKRKVSFKEFITSKNLKRGEAAGFKMYIDGVEFMTSKEWDSTYNKYITRK